MALLLTVHVGVTVALLLVFLLVVCAQRLVRRPVAAVVVESVRSPVPQAEDAADAA